MEKRKAVEAIENAQTFLGIEFGSTRIKGVLIGPGHAAVASGGFTWENRFENGVWTYHQDEIWSGLRACYADLARDVSERYGVELVRLGGIGVSGMMHGYLPFAADGRLLTPFRTWRNTITGRAAAELTELLKFNIPQRWTAAHLYQAVLNGEDHVGGIDYLTTLAGYVHWRLTGKKVVGTGEASGIFPLDSATGGYDAVMLEKFQAACESHGWKRRAADVFPAILPAGGDAGYLTADGAKLIDPTGTLQPGCPAAPPEGDAGTGMVATNSVAPRTGNVSAGTSIFSMVVLEKPLGSYYEEIDMVTTPTGAPVAMVHCNNCTNEINAWAVVFRGLLEALGVETDMGGLYAAMFRSAALGEKDCGGLTLYNYLSGEPVAGLAEGRPLMFRGPEARLTFPNFMRAQLCSAVATLQMGMDILAKENVRIDRLYGHGGFFKTPVAGQSILAAATGAPITVMDSVGEGGAWGMALLAAYRAEKAGGETLEDYLSGRVFAGQEGVTLSPGPEDREGFRVFMDRYRAGLAVEKAACRH